MSFSTENTAKSTAMGFFSFALTFRETTVMNLLMTFSTKSTAMGFFSFALTFREKNNVHSSLLVIVFTMILRYVIGTVLHLLLTPGILGESTLEEQLGHCLELGLKLVAEHGLKLGLEHLALNLSRLHKDGFTFCFFHLTLDLAPGLTLTLDLDNGLDVAAPVNVLPPLNLYLFLL